jgi:hypothetical protein
VHAGSGEARDVVGAVGDNQWRLLLVFLGRGGGTQLVRQRLHGGDQARLVTGVAIECLAEERHIALAGRCQRQQPLLQVGAVVP